MENRTQEHEVNSPFLRTMRERGFIAQCTDLAGLDGLLGTERVTAYVGFDATADSLHVGHLVSLMSMRHLAAAGHRVIALVGGATSLVGDPSFRNTTRPMLTKEDVSNNIEGIRRNIAAVLGRHAGCLTVVDNAEWLGKAGMVDFMRAVGSHFTVARMLSMESVSGRLDAGQPMSMLEFSYMLLQAADFLELSRRHGCMLQMGGSDQWGNICNGIELARRTDGKSLFGLTTQLLTNAAGEKMGKTAGGAVWLSPNRLHPSDFWQFWRNVEDRDVERFLALFTELPLEEIASLCAAGGESLNAAKRVLADEVTAIVHGREAAREAKRKADCLFSDSDAGPTHAVKTAAGRIGLLDLMLQVGFAGTKGEGRRLIRGRAVKVDGKTAEDEGL